MGIVKLSGLNDYLSPSPECILPVINKKSNLFEVQLRTDPVDNLEKKPVKVTLSDCLSCSGCMTSSEPLLENNFYLKVFDTLLNSKCSVVSISTQTLLSLSTKYKQPLTTIFNKIKSFFIKKGVKYVFNQSLAEAIQLQESKKEFDRFYHKNIPLVCSNCPGWVIYAEKSLDAKFLANMSRILPIQAIQGLIVKFVLPIRLKIQSNLRQYRNIFNSLPLFLPKKDDIIPNEIYHLCITPCHDKKLEAVRPDLVANYSNLCKLLQLTENKSASTLFVDAVITTNELEQLLTENFDQIQSVNYEDYSSSELLNTSDIKSIKSLLGIQHNSFNNCVVNTIVKPYNNTNYAHSGAYAEEIFKYAAKKYNNQVVNEVYFNNITNKDYKQAIIFNSDKLPVTKAINISVATGFKNIANIISNLNSNSNSNSKLNFVELMACPGGCINGGGQIKDLIVDIGYDDRTYMPSEQVPAIIELENWLWREMGKLISRSGGLLTMELKSIKDTRIDW